VKQMWLRRLEVSWNLMAHGDAREGKCRGNWRMEWVTSNLHTTSETWCIQHLLPLMRTPRLPVVDWTDASADLNGLVRFAERRNLVSVRVPSHFKRVLPHIQTVFRPVVCVAAQKFRILIRRICTEFMIGIEGSHVYLNSNLQTRDEANTVELELHLSGLIWTASHPDNWIFIWK